jgi:hypothetical protein
MCALKSNFRPVQADYKGVINWYIKLFTKITVYCGKCDQWSVFQAIYQNHC